MDINLNTALNADRVSTVDVDDAEKIISAKPDQLRDGGIFGPALTVTERQLTGLEAFEESEGVDLRRDDPLGKLVLSAFDLKPPESPEFI